MNRIVEGEKTSSMLDKAFSDLRWRQLSTKW